MLEVRKGFFIPPLPSPERSCLLLLFFLFVVWFVFRAQFATSSGCFEGGDGGGGGRFGSPERACLVLLALDGIGKILFVTETAAAVLSDC